MIVGGVDGSAGSGCGEMRGLGDGDIGRPGRRRRIRSGFSCFLILADSISCLRRRDGERAE
jgi:hypothetical protein